jgi:hypothetical protein
VEDLGSESFGLTNYIWSQYAQQESNMGAEAYQSSTNLTTMLGIPWGCTDAQYTCPQFSINYLDYDVQVERGKGRVKGKAIKTFEINIYEHVQVQDLMLHVHPTKRIR